MIAHIAGAMSVRLREVHRLHLSDRLHDKIQE